MVARRTTPTRRLARVVGTSSERRRRKGRRRSSLAEIGRWLSSGGGRAARRVVKTVRESAVTRWTMSRNQSPAPSPRSGEAAAFLDSLQGVPPGQVSACQGWTAHEVTAHLAAGAAEVSRHLEPFLAGASVPATRSFEEREAPYQAMDDRQLRRRLETEEQRMRSLLGAALTADPDAIIPWTGRRMPVAKFIPHMRSEFAIHRWDITGESDDLLGQPDLTGHAVQVLGPLLLRRGLRRVRIEEQPFVARLRCPDQPDVRISATNQHSEIALVGTEAPEEPWLDCDPAARLLFTWGRPTDRTSLLVSHMTPGMLKGLQALLAGY